MHPPKETPADHDLSAKLAAHPYHGLPNIPRAYRLGGRVHKDRISLKGVRIELIKRIKSFGATATPSKMLIYGRPRSGTTLLGALMGQVPGIHDAGERLHHGTFSPIGILETSAATCGDPAFVVKLLTYQMLEVQRIRDPLRFFQKLGDRGYELVHLRRETFPQVVSICTARQVGFYFDRSGKRSSSDPIEIDLDLDAFATQYRRSKLMLDYEDLLMSGLPHMRLQYESDLEDETRHQTVVDRLCDKLSIPTGPVKAKTKRTGGSAGLVKVTNRDDLARIAEQLDAEIEPLLTAR